MALAPDVILASGTSGRTLVTTTRTVPIVFPIAVDPVAAGLVESLARPDGNATGFMSFEIGVSAKWLELLKEIAPGIKRVAVLRTLATAAGPGQFGVIQAVAPTLGVELRPIDTRDAGEIERAVVAFASEPNSGLIATTGGGVLRHRELIVRLRRGTVCRRSRLPQPRHQRRPDVLRPDNLDQYRRAAGYVDRILGQNRPTCRCKRRRVRAGDQPQDCQGARPHCAADAARARRRGDRGKARAS